MSVELTFAYMKKPVSLSFVSIVLFTALVAGCGQPPQVDQSPNQVKPNFSPAHKAMIEERKKQDGG